jgi:hypothetical protein
MYNLILRTSTSADNTTAAAAAAKSAKRGIFLIVGAKKKHKRNVSRVREVAAVGREQEWQVIGGFRLFLSHLRLHFLPWSSHLISFSVSSSSGVSTVHFRKRFGDLLLS